MIKEEKIVIIGNGPAGCTAALYAARAGFSPLVLAGNLPGGLLTWTTTVENYPGIPDGVDGYELVNNMQSQAENFGAQFEYDTVKEVNFDLTSNNHTLILESDNIIQTKAIIIATGAKPKYLDLPGVEKYKSHGISACATCDGSFFKGVPVAVLGGGDSAMEEALTLTRFASVVHLIHRRNQFRASKIMAQRVKDNEKIIIHWNTTPVEFIGHDKLEAIKLMDVNTKETSILNCSACFFALGHIPDTELFVGKLNLDDHGFIKTNVPKTSTNIPGVFAAGDCTDPFYRQAITAAGSGCKAALDALSYLENLK